jgi:hypothetical protein
MRTFIYRFLHMVFRCPKRHGKSDARFTIQVSGMQADMAKVFFTGKNSLGTGAERDGLREQEVLLKELSVKLDEYFALRTFGPDDETAGG